MQYSTCNVHVSILYVRYTSSSTAERCKVLTGKSPLLFYCNIYSPSSTNLSPCKTSNIIYLIQRRKCDLQYVGETRQPLHNRMNSHCFDIVHRRTDGSPMAAHFNSEDHSETNFLVIIINIYWKEDTILGKIRDSWWIRTLGTSWPSGLNLRTNCL